MEWKDYFNDRLIAEHPTGFYVIKPKSERETKPIFCPLCEAIMVGELNADAYKKFQCCDSCATFWAYPNKDKWQEGWRPSPNDVMNKYKDGDT